MKKVLSVIMVCVLTVSLIVYFSWSGNTENIANAIAGQTGADVDYFVLCAWDGGIGK